MAKSIPLGGTSVTTRWCVSWGVPAFNDCLETGRRKSVRVEKAERDVSTMLSGDVNIPGANLRG